MEREVLVLTRGTTADLLLAALTDARERTMRLVDRLEDRHLDRGEPNSVSSGLYHVAAIEADWLYDEIRGEPDEIPAALFPHDVREEDGRLTPVHDQTLDDHRKRLATVRAELVATIQALDEEALHRTRRCPNYDVSPAYVLHHLMQHEAEHRAELGRAVMESDRGLRIHLSSDSKIASKNVRRTLKPYRASSSLIRSARASASGHTFS